MTTEKSAEPAQPVAWMSTYDKQLLPHHPVEYGRDPSEWVPLFAAPQPPADVPRLSLADFRLLIAASSVKFHTAEEIAELRDLCLAVEAEVRRRCGVKNA